MTITAAKVASFALSLPEVDQQETWGHATFRVHGKIFASLPDERTAVVKSTPAEQRSLASRAPDTYSAAPRVGRYGWVAVRLSRVPADDLRRMIRQAWSDVAPQGVAERTGRRPQPTG